MNKKLLFLIIVAAGAGLVFTYKNSLTNILREDGGFDPRTVSYRAEGESAHYFGNQARGDLDGDGREDLAYLITRDGAGSGTFYYAIVALNTASGYRLTNPVLIGDRIAPQSTYIPKASREIQVNYAQRRPSEPMTAKPSVGAVRILKVNASGKLEGVME